MLLRSLVPSWKFFEDIGDTPFLDFRFQIGTSGGSENKKDWQSAHPQHQRKLFQLFFNPEINLHLAERSALQHFVQHYSEDKNSLNTQVSLEIIQNIVRQRIPLEAVTFEFKITLSSKQSSFIFYQSERLHR